MQSKQGLLLGAEVLSGLDGPVKAIREATPQAVHHFTRFDQVNRLVRASGRTPMGTNPFRLLCMAHTSPGLCSRLYASALLQKSDSIPNALPPDRLGDGQKRLHLPI